MGEGRWRCCEADWDEWLRGASRPGNQGPRVASDAGKNRVNFFFFLFSLFFLLLLCSGSTRFAREFDVLAVCGGRQTGHFGVGSLS